MPRLRFAVTVPVLLTLALSGCGRSSTDTPAAGSTGSAAKAGFAANSVIGVALPQKTSENWVLAEGLFNNGLKAAGVRAESPCGNGSGRGTQDREPRPEGRQRGKEV